MTNIRLSGDREITAEDAESVKRYTPSLQEYTDEVADDPVDKTPVDQEQQERLREATADTYQPLHAPDAAQPERAERFEIPGQWVHPKVKAQRAKQMMFASSRALDDLDERVASVMRHDGAPKQVKTAETKARNALADARQVRIDGAHHPDNPRYARDTAAKDEAAVKAAEAVRAVAALEAAAEQHAEEWLENVVTDIPDLQAKAAKALDAASKAYSEWRGAISSGEALAREQGRWGDWHSHPDEREIKPERLVGEIRRARDLAKTEDPYLSGAYLVDDPTEDGKVPEWTLAALKKSAEQTPGSYAEQVYMRVVSPHAADHPVRDAIADKDLRIIHTRPIPTLNQRQAAWEEHARAVDPTR